MFGNGSIVIFAFHYLYHHCPQMLLASEGVDLHFTEAAIHEVARVSEELNLMLQNIGARRWERKEMEDHLFWDEDDVVLSRGDIILSLVL